MQLKTITTIELSNKCNLACKYCINRFLVNHPAREVGIMSDDVFERSLDLLDRLCKKGTQQEVNLNGNGESFLDPQLVSRAKRVKDVMGERKVGLSTNAVNLTYAVVKGLKDAGVDQMDLSIHSPYHVRKAIYIMHDLQINGGLNMGALKASHNWAGQLPDEDTVDVRYSLPCDPLVQGRGYIQKEGKITPCCYDYRNLGTFTSVFDSNVLEAEMYPYELCRTCHQIIPQGLMMSEGWDMEPETVGFEAIRAGRIV